MAQRPDHRTERLGGGRPQHQVTKTRTRTAWATGAPRKPAGSARVRVAIRGDGRKDRGAASPTRRLWARPSWSARTASIAGLQQLKPSFCSSKKGLEGDGVSARQALAAIQAARETGAIDTPNEPIVFLTTYEEPGHVGDALECLRIARSLDRYRETRRYVLETWIVEAALERLGDRRLTPQEQSLARGTVRATGVECRNAQR
jgi:hypothetical protein